MHNRLFRIQALIIQPTFSPFNTCPLDHVTAYYFFTRSGAIKGGRDKIQNSPLCSMLINFAKSCDEKCGKVFEVLAFVYSVCSLLP